MRTTLALLAAALLLAGCRAAAPGIQAAYRSDETGPGYSNDGFYDGGVFDQDSVDAQPDRTGGIRR